MHTFTAAVLAGFVGFVCGFSPLSGGEPAEQSAPPAEEQPPASHAEAARRLVEILQETKACLAGCKDAATVEAALPCLRKLAARARRLQLERARLPDPSTQDYIAGHECLVAFNTAWQAIRAHIKRLSEAELITPELNDILLITPPKRPSPPQS